MMLAIPADCSDAHGRRSLTGYNLLIWSAAIHCTLVVQHTVNVSLR
jgi:hypothetical protein